MAEIYTTAWYDSMKEILNASDEVTKSAPKGIWNILAEIHGDGTSPYIAVDDVKRFAIVLDNGKCESYQELTEAPARKDFEFILEMPASLFERVVANQADPLEAGLKGDVKIVGDMRVLIQNAELVSILADIYQREIETEWPNGAPPYDAAPAGGAS
ncbi:MAG: SCP2 sterol-binding domain-containing protein [Chloroflexi bacterium]|nr:SCP2 sterol-binding domain-containing protein [Chloroflexota bacterium]